MTFVKFCIEYDRKTEDPRKNHKPSGAFPFFEGDKRTPGSRLNLKLEDKLSRRWLSVSQPSATRCSAARFVNDISTFASCPGPVYSNVQSVTLFLLSIRALRDADKFEDLGCLRAVNVALNRSEGDLIEMCVSLRHYIQSYSRAVLTSFCWSISWTVQTSSVPGASIF